MSINLPNVYSQRDSRWSKKLLGFNTSSKYDIYNYGCLVASLAMVASYYGYSDNPDTLNELLKVANGYVAGGGDYKWGSITKVYKDIEEYKTNTPLLLTDFQINEIKGALDQYYPAMVQLDVNPKTVGLDMHYVVIIGYDPKDENNFLIADPLGGELVSLRKYLGWWKPSARKTIEQYIIYKGKVPSDLSAKDKKIADLETYVSSLEKEHKKALADAEIECQNRMLGVKRKLEKVVSEI